MHPPNQATGRWGYLELSQEEAADRMNKRDGAGRGGGRWKEIGREEGRLVWEGRDEGGSVQNLPLPFIAGRFS